MADETAGETPAHTAAASDAWGNYDGSSVTFEYEDVSKRFEARVGL